MLLSRLFPALLVALAVALPAALPARAETVTVFAAASLKTALDQIAADWQAKTGDEVVLSYGGTPQLAKQIIDGAPADIFISASPQWMNEVATAGLLVSGSRVDLLGNTLVLVAPGGVKDPVDLGAAQSLVQRLQGGKLAMALVDAVPAGQYGKQALTALGHWAGVEPLVVQSENVRAALALVTAGEAELGVVYASDAVAAGDSVTVVATFPDTSHDPILYPAARIAGSERGDAFFAALLAPDAAGVFRANGFEVLIP